MSITETFLQSPTRPDLVVISKKNKDSKNKQITGEKNKKTKKTIGQFMKCFSFIFSVLQIKQPNIPVKKNISDCTI